MLVAQFLIILMLLLVMGMRSLVWEYIGLMDLVLLGKDFD